MSSLLTPQEATTENTALPEELVRLQTENKQLCEALLNRIVIEQAKAAVSSRLGILPDEAFELLRAAFHAHSVSEFAAQVVKNQGADEIAGQLPEE
jgi:AmiR/NasT family two-component response regulator